MEFPAEIHDKLLYYVYRLIDPRDGSTFYIGKGQGNRVFAHVKGSLKFENDEEDDKTAKIRTINQIKNAGLEPIHIIHRHGMNQDEAFQVEAALIDATPGLTNEVGGRNSSDFGPAHAQQLIQRYRKETMVIDPTHKIMLINVKGSIEERELYDAVRFAWRVNKEKAEGANYVFAVSGGICRDVFVAKEWRHAIKENFPGLTTDTKEDTKRFGFIGELAPEPIRIRYKGKRLPDNMKPKKGAQSPIRYYYPE